MSPKQVEDEIRKELQINERLADLLQQHAKTYADSLYRRCSDIIDHASLLRLTGVAAGVEAFVSDLIPKKK